MPVGFAKFNRQRSRHYKWHCFGGRIDGTYLDPTAVVLVDLAVIGTTFFLILDDDNTIQTANQELLNNTSYYNNFHKLPND